MPRKEQDDDQVMRLVETALAAPPDERRGCVESACAGNSELLEEVWECIQWELRMDRFLCDPVFSPVPAEAVFKPGQLLEGRFRIVGEVARGGMGVVYEARDEKLDRRIALKCARPGFRKRLPPEVRNASEISHPNVCKIFEIHTASTADAEFEFLTMEFLDGETLAEHFRRGPLPAPDVRSIAQQLCAGLGEAHRRKVIHGDLKSSNVIVTRDSGGGLRAVITDFGLAHGAEAAERVAPGSEVGGTPGYMAPELWRGAKASVASDIYALGVILDELAFGPRAEGAERTRKRHALHPKWTHVIRRCLDPEPTRRFHSAEEVAKALAPRTRRRLLLAAAGAMLAVASGVVTYRGATAPKESVRLAVMPWESAPATAASGEVLSRDASALISRLKGNRKTRFAAIPGGRGLRARWQASPTHTLHGKLEPEKGRLVLNACVTDARSLVDVKCRTEVYAPGDMKYAPVALAGLVTETFRLPSLAELARVNAAAQPDYSAGLALLSKNSGVEKGLLLLERAVATDPDSPLTYAALAEAEWWRYQTTNDPVWLGRAKDSVRKASLRNGDLAEVHRIAGLLQANEGWYEQAQLEYLRAIELDPTNGDAYRRLGTAYRTNKQLDQALTAYLRAIELDPGNYRNHQALGGFFSEGDNHTEAVRHFAEMVELAPEEPSAHFALGRTYLDLGRFAEAEAELRLSLALGETGEALNTLGLVLTYERRDEEAIPFFSRSVEKSPEKFLLWINLAAAYRRVKRPANAERANRHGLALAEREMRKNPRDGYVRSCLAYLCAWLNQRSRAESEVAQALQLSPQDNDARWMAVKTYEALGRRDDAIRVLANVPPEFLADANRHPDLADLCRDSRFQEMMARKPVR